jgi:CubicO group peptidase (beta-lactamase class C family)
MTDTVRSAHPRLEVEVDSGSVGLDGHQLGRLTAALRRYVDDGRLPGWALLVSRQGKVALLDTCGQRDLDSQQPIETDTIFRIYSMSKPVTSVAAMQLVERGALALTDPVADYLPAFADMRVFVGGSSVRPMTVPATEPIRVWHLLTHTAGLTYGFLYNHPVDAMYRAAGYEWTVPADLDLAAAVDAWAQLPLVFQPGTEWNYSHATDVLGRLVEVVSGQSLDDYFADHILDPLGMVDTSFRVGADRVGRLATLYTPDRKTGAPTPLPSMGDLAIDPNWLSGGGGLMSTLHDYYRFARMLLGGGQLDGVRLLGERTVRYMTHNHLPGGADLAEFGRPIVAEIPFDGVGFGLGFSVTQDPVKAKVLGSAGDFAWGGAASTFFWVDPTEELIVVFMTQLLPSSTYPIRSQLRQMIYPALIG